MSSFVLIVAAGAAGYVISVLTWARLRLALIGIDNEIDDLRAKARVLEDQLGG